MNRATKICQNCKTEFKIEPEDFEFYAKIKVPPPTFCPDCRLQRRLAWRNERTLYKRKCDAPGHNEEIISIYHKDSPFKVYDQKYWWSDNWDPMDYGKDYDWNKPFFEQFGELIIEAPRAALHNKNAINSDFTNYGVNIVNCYFTFGGRNNENLLYSTSSLGCKLSLDLYKAVECELCYENIDCIKSYKLFFGEFAENCIDSIFLSGCRNLSNCLGCVNLRNTNYNILNRPYSKKEYFEKFHKFDLNTFNGKEKFLIEFKKFKAKFPNKFIRSAKTNNVSGHVIMYSNNCHGCFDVIEVENCTNGYFLAQVKDSFDVNNCGQSEFIYDTINTNLSNRIVFSVIIWTGYNIQYSDNCYDCHDLFGCVNLRNKQYCILNKQYTKEEYEKLVPKIIEHMNSIPYIDKRGRVYRYGEFFPVELSPFSYNETVAQEYFPLTKEEASNKGYSWKEPEIRNYQITIKAEDLPDHIKDVKDDILNQIIGCLHQGKCNEQCTTAFKIIPQELEFYRKMNLPLPRLCPNCRHYQRIKQRNPLKLWHRKCQCAGKASDPRPAISFQSNAESRKSNAESWSYQNTIEHPHHKQDHCPNEFETSYAPERPEIVYCEQCYLQEVV